MGFFGLLIKTDQKLKDLLKIERMHINSINIFLYGDGIIIGFLGTEPPKPQNREDLN